MLITEIFGFCFIWFERLNNISMKRFINNNNNNNINNNNKSYWKTNKISHQLLNILNWKESQIRYNWVKSSLS